MEYGSGVIQKTQYSIAPLLQLTTPASNTGVNPCLY